MLKFASNIGSAFGVVGVVLMANEITSVGAGCAFKGQKLDIDYVWEVYSYKYSMDNTGTQIREAQRGLRVLQWKQGSHHLTSNNSDVMQFH